MCNKGHNLSFWNMHFCLDRAVHMQRELLRFVSVFKILPPVSITLVKYTDTSGELLVPLGYRDKQWNVLEKVSIRNLQNSLVSFEMQENFDK